MIIARWSITARFGHVQDAVALLKEWNETFGVRVGFDFAKGRIVVGSIGTSESLIQTDIPMESLAALEAGFGKLSDLDGHAAWGKKMESVIVSGSNRWDVMRVV